MAVLRSIAEALGTSEEPVVLATVVRVVGSSYGGVGSRMVARVDGTTVSPAVAAAPNVSTMERSAVMGLFVRSSADYADYTEL